MPITEIQINKTCGELLIGSIYQYSMPYFLEREDCTYSWKAQDGTVLGFGSLLNHSSCEDGIQHVIRCFNPTNVTNFHFNVSNITTPGPANVYEAHTGTIIIIALLVFVILIGIMVAAWGYVNRRPNQPPAKVEEGSCHAGENHPMNTMDTESEEPRDARVNGSSTPTQQRYRIPDMIQNITKFCDEIHVDGVFRYTPPPGSPQSRRCDFSWYAQNETVLGYDTSLVRDACETGIRLTIRCHDAGETDQYIYQVTRPEESFNETLPGDNVDEGFKHLSWLLLLLLLVLLVLCYVYRKQIFSWFSSGPPRHCCALVFCTKGTDAESSADVPSSRKE
ncbi:uncharacterized protein DAT39_004327, partial [Clarias magur]